MSKTKLRISALIILALAVGVSLYISITRKPDLTYVKASGTVEVTQVQLAPQASGRIIELPIEESQHIKKGDLIAKMSLDGADDDVEMARFALEAAKSQLADLERGYREEDIARTEAEVSAVSVQYAQAERDAKRFADLAADGVVSKREAELYIESRDAKYNKLKAAKEQLRLLKNGMRQDQIEAARANVKRAEAAYEKAITLIGYKEFYSPADGVILTKNYELGDVVAAGAPIACLGKEDDTWVKLYIPATQLGRIKLGDHCEVHVDPYPDKIFEAAVTEVNQKAEYNPRLSLTQSERENMVFWVKVKIKNTEGTIKPGMPADVTIK